MSKEKDILDEVVGKIEDYEKEMSSWIEDSNLYADLYCIRPPKRKNNTFSNPRLPEMHRAVEALTTTAVRMMTAKDPYFSVNLVDFDVDDKSVYTVQRVLETQARVSQYKQYLTKAFRSLIPMGIVIVDEPFEWVKLNPFGREIPVTRFLPRSILQMGFDRSSIDINFCDWIYTNDIISKGRLQYMAENDATGAWIKKSVEAVIQDTSKETNEFIQDRLSSANYYAIRGNVDTSCELVIHHGLLETMNDGLHYIVGVVNRRHIVKFLANPDQTGNRNFRIAKWIDFEGEPLGYGLGRLLARNHRAMDANRQKTQDLLSFGTYNIWLKNNAAGINSQDLVMRPNKVISTGDMGGLRQLITDTGAALNGLKLEEILKNDFRNASGATDTLQASVTEATASEVAIVQNEAMRRLSVYVENIAESLGRDHFIKMHNNNRMNLDRPFVVSSTNGPIRVYPKDINIDVDIEMSIVTDKDFRPKRTEQLLKVLELSSSIRQENPDKFMIDTLPIYREIMRSMDVDPKEIIRDIDEAAELAVANLQMKQMQNMPSAGGAPEADEEVTGGVGTEMTPIGPVSASVNAPAIEEMNQ